MPLRSASISSDLHRSSPNRSVVWCIFRAAVRGAGFPIAVRDMLYHLAISHTKPQGGRAMSVPISHSVAPPAAGELLASISRRIVQLLARHAGKGPTKCKTHWAGSDMLVVVLGGGYTEAEQTLYERGRAED